MPLLTAAIVSFLLSSSPAFAEEIYPGAIVELVLSDGQTVTGRLARQDDEAVLVRLEDDTILTITRAEVVSMQLAAPSKESRIRHRTWDFSASSTRYMSGPSALSMEAGEGYFSQRGLAVSVLGLSLSDWLDLSVGGVLPAYFAGQPNLGVGLKASTEVVRWVHVGVGVSGAAWLQAGFTGNGYGVLTLGGSDNNLTGLAGVTNINGEVQPVVMVGSTLLVEPGWALMTETWVVQGEDPPVLPGVAIRWFRDWGNLDVGIYSVYTTGITYVVPAGRLPAPWVSFTWMF